MERWGVCEQGGWRKGPWTPDEDKLLAEHISQYGEGRWSYVSKSTSLKRSGKSCRLRWMNYLRPGLKKGHLTPQEKGIIIELHALWGNKWSTIARYLPGRTDNEIKNYWRTHFKNTKPSSTKQLDKKRNLKHKQQQEQIDNKNIINKSLKASEEKNTKQDHAEIARSGNTGDDNHDTTLPIIYNDRYNTFWSDFVPMDFNVRGVFWDLDDPNWCNNLI